METQLTRTIKRGLPYFRLNMPTQMRTPRYAEEVWTPTGLVDLIRFEDYKCGEQYKCRRIHHNEFTEQVLLPADALGACKIPDASFPNAHCEGCMFRTHTYHVGRLITCFEVKITLEDFKSKNGHNFHGHHNYYVVPKEIVHKVRELLPDGIGLIAYYPDSGAYRVVQECVRREVTPELEAELLYNAFKKWVDKFRFEYFCDALVHESTYLSHNPGSSTKGETLW